MHDKPCTRMSALEATLCIRIMRHSIFSVKLFTLKLMKPEEANFFPQGIRYGIRVTLHDLPDLT